MLHNLQVCHHLTLPVSFKLNQLAQLEALLFEDNWDTPAINSALRQFGAGFLVAFNDGQLVGYCIYQLVFETAEILRIGTHPNYQGQGVAQALMSAFVALCQDQAAEHILLEVRADNQPAIGLYERFGFVQIDRRKNYYQLAGTKIDALILQKRL